MNKNYYAIKVQYMAPIEVVYKIYADDEDEALKIFESNPPNRDLAHPPHIKWGGVKRLAVKIMKYGWTEILKSKTYRSI